LFLTASFFAPHPPLFPPKRFFEHFASEKLATPAHGDWVNWKALSPKGDAQGHRVLLEGRALHATQAGYYGLIEQLDEQLGPLIEDFKNRSRRAGHPWIIVFTADHGEMLGDHGFFRKCEPFEGAANIPFLIAASGAFGLRSGVRCDQPVCLEDILPTLLELARVPRPKPMDGVSLAPFLWGDTHPIRAWLHSEHAPCYSQEQAFHALTDGHMKYIWRPHDGTEYLFNLDENPREEHDLSKADGQQAVLEKWRSRLIRELASRPEGFSDGAKLIPGRAYPALQAR
jgi:arylsulfatase A-like enzyme